MRVNEKKLEKFRQRKEAAEKIHNEALKKRATEIINMMIKDHPDLLYWPTAALKALFDQANTTGETPYLPKNRQEEETAPEAA